MTSIISRPSPDDLVSMPYYKICDTANRDAQQAEVILMRKLLMRAYGMLQDVATKARSDGRRDPVVEAIMVDISAALDKPPTLI